MNKKILASDADHLIKIIQKEMKSNGKNCDLNHIDISQVKDLGYIFCESDFNGDISKWDTSNVTHMDGLFKSSEFNGDISKWDVSKLENINEMFESSQFNGDISNWNVTNLKSMDYTFKNSHIECDLSNWKPYKLESIFCAFTSSVIPMPYWTDYKDHDERRNAIDLYHATKFSEELDKELNKTEKIEKKLKL